MHQLAHQSVHLAVFEGSVDFSVHHGITGGAISKVVVDQGVHNGIVGLAVFHIVHEQLGQAVLAAHQHQQRSGLLGDQRVQRHIGRIVGSVELAVIQQIHHQLGSIQEGILLAFPQAQLHLLVVVIPTAQIMVILILLVNTMVIVRIVLAAGNQPLCNHQVGLVLQHNLNDFVCQIIYGSATGIIDQINDILEIHIKDNGFFVLGPVFPEGVHEDVRGEGVAGQQFTHRLRADSEMIRQCITQLQLQIVNIPGFQDLGAEIVITVPGDGALTTPTADHHFLRCSQMGLILDHHADQRLGISLQRFAHSASFMCTVCLARQSLDITDKHIINIRISCPPILGKSVDKGSQHKVLMGIFLGGITGEHIDHSSLPLRKQRLGIPVLHKGVQLAGQNQIFRAITLPQCVQVHIGIQHQRLQFLHGQFAHDQVRNGILDLSRFFRHGSAGIPIVQIADDIVDHIGPSVAVVTLGGRSFRIAAGIDRADIRNRDQFRVLQFPQGHDQVGCLSLVGAGETNLDSRFGNRQIGNAGRCGQDRLQLLQHQHQVIVVGAKMIKYRIPVRAVLVVLAGIFIIVLSVLIDLLGLDGQDLLVGFQTVDGGIPDQPGAEHQHDHNDQRATAHSHQHILPQLALQILSDLAGIGTGPVQNRVAEIQGGSVSAHTHGKSGIIEAIQLGQGDAQHILQLIDKFLVPGQGAGKHTADKAAAAHLLGTEIFQDHGQIVQLISGIIAAADETLHHHLASLDEGHDHQILLQVQMEIRARIFLQTRGNSGLGLDLGLLLLAEGDLHIPVKLLRRRALSLGLTDTLAEGCTHRRSNTVSAIIHSRHRQAAGIGHSVVRCQQIIRNRP